MAHSKGLSQRREVGMKYLMSAFMISLVLAIAMPAWAQTPTHHRHPTYRHNMYGMYGGHRSHYSAADRLNAEELNVLRGGPPAHRMPSGGKQLTDPYH